MRRSGAPALGGLRNPRAVAALLGALRNPLDRFLEHSLIHAVIEIASREGIDPAGLHKPATSPVCSIPAG